jgi:hypothetical protein
VTSLRPSMDTRRPVVIRDWAHLRRQSYNHVISTSFCRTRPLVKSVNCQWICRFADHSSANSDLSQSKCLSRAVFLQRSLARIVHAFRKSFVAGCVRGFSNLKFWCHDCIALRKMHARLQC